MISQRPSSRRRPGAVLLEAIVALAILITALVPILVIATDAIGAAFRAATLEERSREAGRLMVAVSLWPREDLDRRLGRAVQGAFVLRVQRPDRWTYEIAISDSLDDNVLIQTALFRP